MRLLKQWNIKRWWFLFESSLFQDDKITDFANGVWWIHHKWLFTFYASTKGISSRHMIGRLCQDPFWQQNDPVSRKNKQNSWMIFDSRLQRSADSCLPAALVSLSLKKLLPASDSQNNTIVILWVRLKDSDSTRHFLCDVWIVSVRRRRPASRKRINMSLFPLQVCSITRSASLKHSRWSQLLKLTLWGWGVVWQSAVCLAWIEPRRRHKNMFTYVKAEECHRDEWTGKEQ